LLFSSDYHVFSQQCFDFFLALRWEAVSQYRSWFESLTTNGIA
jgi:hypothetical protein